MERRGDFVPPAMTWRPAPDATSNTDGLSSRKAWTEQEYVSDGKYETGKPRRTQATRDLGCCAGL